MSLPYFKHNPSDYLHDPKVIKLNYEDRGIFWQLINEMWTARMELPADDEYLAALLRLPLDKWLDSKKRLSIGTNPLIYSFNGLLVNEQLKAKYFRAAEYSLAQALKRQKKDTKPRKITRI